jgi:hypothetical protein
MATEISRTFDRDHGSIAVQVRDSYGHDSFHTIYVAGVPDVDAAVAQLLVDAETQAGVIHARMVAAGWTP